MEIRVLIEKEKEDENKYNCTYILYYFDLCFSPFSQSSSTQSPLQILSPFIVSFWNLP